jgi:hypothetical protein
MKRSSHEECDGGRCSLEDGTKTRAARERAVQVGEHSHTQRPRETRKGELLGGIWTEKRKHLVFQGSHLDRTSYGRLVALGAA